MQSTASGSSWFSRGVGMPDVSRHPAFLPFALSFALVAVLAVYYWTLLPVGSIRFGDEYLTLDRVNAFVIRDDFWTVYSGNLPTFKKPPLQYWISAFLVRQGADLEFALRFPSYLFGLLTLINVGFLAYLIFPNPWVAPAATALLAGSGRFWNVNLSAHLDSGAALFSTLAITGCLLAFSRPRWWYLVALATGLAAWQKAPIPLVFVAGISLVLIAGRKRLGIDVRAAFQNRHFWIAAGLMLAALLFWPALQWIKFGPASLQEAYVSQMVERFSPFGPGDGCCMQWHTVLFNGEYFLRIPAILAVLALPWILHRMDLFPLPLLLIVYVIATAFAAGYISPRYTLILMPLLMAALAAVTIKLLPGKILPVVAIAGLAMSAGGPIKSARALGLLGSNQEKYIPLLQNVAKSVRKDESLVVCRHDNENSRIMYGAFSYFGSNGHPFYEVRPPEEFAQLAKEKRIAPPYRGLCPAKGFEELKPLLGSVTVVEESHGYVHWTTP